MDYRENKTNGTEGRGGSSRRRNRYYGKVILLCIMIGFCILALIEIVYGQEKLRLERERVALEEQNARTLEALEKEQEDGHSANTAQAEPAASEDEAEMTNLKAGGAGEAGAAAAPEAEAADGGEAAAEQEEEDEEDDEYDMQIVFMGDSILDNDRYDEGIADLVSQNCNARVYNLSMGGTTAALSKEESSLYSRWDSRSLLGVVNAIMGRIDTSIFDGYIAGDLLKKCDFSKTDYFVIEYGINDFLSQIPPTKYLADGVIREEDDAHTYGGALNEAVVDLLDHFPDAKVVLIMPHYCQFFSGDVFIGDGYSLNFGYGTLIEYARACAYVYDQHRHENVILYNAFEESGIDAYTADDYLEDGVHLSAQGRRRYADDLTIRIMKDFYPDE
ncbi:MAG: SGNH/GDSL hydrolase family protein [Blautia sp.]|nr:SGNH/GDSL hydrolase family protein [Blautia sp.]MCM1199608.1 SGNH/GDSL hydrolase family protein [Bacteroides fragilis]